MLLEDYKTLLLAKVGGASEVEDNQELIWKRFESIPNLELRYNYALIDAIEILLGGSWMSVDVTTAAGERMAFSQAFSNLLKMAQVAQEYINGVGNLLAATGADAAPTVAEMLDQYPIPTPPGVRPDPNSAYYTGDPLWIYRNRRAT